ncbi:hypothetical protein BJX70DRAFT_346084 [Aspergillus crustosus]
MSSSSSSPTTTTTTTTAASSTRTSASSAAARTHTIQVGPKEDPHGYVPHSLNASVGDLIVFEFYPRNHSVVQADWRAPCMPADGDYFNSGIKNEFEEVNGQVIGALPTWNLTVDRDEPMFFYCTGLQSCIVNGMVGIINPNSTRTWESQNRAARDAPYMLLPGQSMPAEGDSLDSNTGTTATHLTSSPPSNSSSSSASHGLGAGPIAGIVIGSVAFVMILCILLFILGRNQVYKKWLSHSQDGSTKDTRTARWALSTSAVGAGAGTGKSDIDGCSTGLPGHMSVPGASPSLNEPGTGTGSTVSGVGLGTVPRFGPMDYTLPLSGIYSIHDNAYGAPSPLLAQYSQQVQQQQANQQQPYWIWDQTIQPNHSAARDAGPSELEADAFK